MVSSFQLQDIIFESIGLAIFLVLQRAVIGSFFYQLWFTYTL
jgi:hypothetical protein